MGVDPDAVVHGSALDEQILSVPGRNDHKRVVPEELLILLRLIRDKGLVIPGQHGARKRELFCIIFPDTYSLHDAVVGFDQRIFGQKTIGIFPQEFTGIDIITEILPGGVFAVEIAQDLQDLSVSQIRPGKSVDPISPAGMPVPGRCFFACGSHMNLHVFIKTAHGRGEPVKLQKSRMGPVDFTQFYQQFGGCVLRPEGSQHMERQSEGGLEISDDERVFFKLLQTVHIFSDRGYGRFGGKLQKIVILRRDQRDQDIGGLVQILFQMIFGTGPCEPADSLFGIAVQSTFFLQNRLYIRIGCTGGISA